MKAGNLLFASIAVFLFPAGAGAQQSLWSKASSGAYNSFTSSGNLPAEKFILSRINLPDLRTALLSAPMERSDKKIGKGIPFSFLLPDETNFSASVEASPIWEAAYAAQFSQVKTFNLSDPLTRTIKGRIALTAEGISGILFTDKGDVYINPLKNTEAGTHILYYYKDEKLRMAECGAKADASVATPGNRPANVLADDCNKRTYRLAVAATAEYTAWAGGQANALTYIAITMNNVSALYDRDLNIRFSLVTPNSILFTDAASDPYPGGDAYLDDNATNANQTAMDNILGSAAYDVGIVLNNGWNRGYVPVPFGYVCDPTKKAKCGAGVNNGSGLNPTTGPQGMAFDLTVAHELGHQFGSSHSYASTVGTCAGFATAAAAFEPGGGSSLMSYGGYPNCNTYVSYAQMYFNAGNIAQIKAYIAAGGSCVTPVATGNNAPVITLAATSYNLPASTPFTLSGTGTDADGNALLYNWEEQDAGLLTPNPPAATNTSGANFRSYPPTISGNSRSFPSMYDIAAGVSPPYEVLSSVTRTLHFRLTARDQSPLGGCTSYEDVALNINAGAGPFKVTSQSSAITWAANSSQTVSWNVASTNAAPVNCTQVNILFSTDGGITYPYTLVSNTPNDGVQMITTPNLATKYGRVKVQAVNNVFFNINAANITVTTTCGADGATITPDDSLTAAAGSAALNITLKPQYGTAFTPSGTITTANPSTFLTIYNNSTNTCATYSYNGAYRFNTHSFVVTVGGTYTFTPSTYGLVYNLYHESFDPLFPCNNFIASNCVTGTSPTTINPNVSADLAPGRYMLVAGTFSDKFPVLPHTYSVAITGGTIFNNAPNPGAAYNYLYVVVDRSTNLVKAIAATANLSNSATYPGGKRYLVYGLSYFTSSPSLTSFVGTNFNTLSATLLTNAAYCGNLSKNFYTVVVQSLYTFTGTGNWNLAANWSNNAIPPSPLPANSSIVINPAGTGECILNVPVTVNQGSQLTVQPGKKFRIMGNLTIQQ